MEIISAVNKIRSRFGTRTAVAIAGSVGFALGAGGWVAASHGADDQAPTTSAVAETTLVESTIGSTSAPSTSGVDTTVVTTIDPVVTSSVVPTSVDVSVSTSVADASTSVPSNNVPSTTIDDASASSSSPENTAASSSSSVPASATPAPFTKTYQSLGGSITVTWNGSALSLDAVSPSAGFQAEIDDQASDRVRVEFDNGDADWRIEVRFEDGSIRERITN